jgi:hypothetical protein
MNLKPTLGLNESLIRIDVIFISLNPILVQIVRCV